MEKLTDFVTRHLDDDTSRLTLDREKWPEIDIPLAVTCIESRRKLRGKVHEWYSEPGLIFPEKLSAEQCSSSATAAYKASLASEIIRQAEMPGIKGKPYREKEWRLADLTGGLGVDSWFFSKRASKVLYCEMQEKLCTAAIHNFNLLGAENIIVRNCMIVPSTGTGPADDNAYDCDPATSGCNAEAALASPSAVLSGFSPDIVYLDPARRGERGRKVFMIEECVPDVLALREEIFIHSRHILLKLSPMADITMAASRLGSTCREIHVVSSGGECKELLIWMDREWKGRYSVTACELHGDGNSIFIFRPEEEREAVAKIAAQSDFEQHGFMLFEPGKSLMKAGVFNLLSERYGLRKLAKSTHYYIMEDAACGNPGRSYGSGDSTTHAELEKMGKFFRIISCRTLDKRSIKEAGAAFPNADVTARNIPMDTETLRKKLSACAPKANASSKCHDYGKTQKPATGQEIPLDCKTEDIHIFGLKSDTAGNLLITTVRQTMERKI